MRLSRSIFVGLIAMALLLTVGTAFAQGGAINVGDTLTQNASNANVDFSLRLSAGDTVVISVNSDAFDTYLEVIDASGAILSFDDDSGDAFNSRLEFTAPTSAAYTLRVRSFAGTANGRFTISVTSGGGSSSNQTSGNVINVGDTINASSTSLTEYSLQLAAGQTVVIEAMSTVFDTYLYLLDSNGRTLASDDDGGDVGTNSRLTFTAPSAGTYVIRVSSFGNDNAGGAFTLSVVASGGGSTSSQTSGAINVGDTINASSTSLTEYSLQLAAGQTVVIEAMSTVFDTYLEVYDSNGRMVASDDDGGDVGTNSRLSFTASSAGTYVIRVRAFGSDNAGGAFTLMVSGSGGGSTSSQTSGAINVGDTINASSTSYADYTVSLAAGDTINISLTSGDFDPYLVLLDSQGTELQTDDDGGDGVNSRMIFTASSAGTYTIRVGSCCVNPPSGSFTLSVTSSQIVGEAQGGELTYGSSFTFEPNGAISSVFSFTGRAGDVINLSILSNVDEDTRMFLFGPDGTEVASDDDSGPSTNPALRRFELPETGTYTVEVQGYGESAVFDPFQIALERTELLLLNNGAITLSLNQDIQSESMAFDVQAGEQYIITITASEKSDASMYVAIQEEGEFYGRTNMNFSNMQVVSFLYEVENSGRAEISIDYYAYTDTLVDFTFEAEPFVEEAPAK